MNNIKSTGIHACRVFAYNTLRGVTIIDCYTYMVTLHVPISKYTHITSQTN